jgi:hypothetical protein
MNDADSPKTDSYQALRKEMPNLAASLDQFDREAEERRRTATIAEILEGVEAVHRRTLRIEERISTLEYRLSEIKARPDQPRRFLGIELETWGIIAFVAVLLLA